MAGDLNLADLIQEADALPKLTRGKSSDDYDVLIKRMSGGSVLFIPNVEEADKSKIGQKIRGAATRAGFKVTVRYSKPEKKVYFQREAEKETDEDRARQAANGYDDTSENEATKSKGTSKKSA